MGVISTDAPCVSLVTGPMLMGSHRGTRIGACTDCRRFWKDYRAGIVDIEEIVQVNDKLVPFICLLSPAICFYLKNNSEKLLGGYVFDNELIIINGLLTFAGLLLTSKAKKQVAVLLNR